MNNEYHILSLSGGKDSTALALYIKENMPEIHEKIEYAFYDTGLDLPETYEYLNKIELFLNKKITYVKPEKSFDDIFAVNKMLPSPFSRWCTVDLKVKPSVNFLKEKIEKYNYDCINLYVGLRADEMFRKGIELKTVFDKKYIKPVYPLREYNFNLEDVNKILIDSGLNYPDYYKWRKRNGCYLCFFQSPLDWINLYEQHPEYFYKAVQYEKEARQGHTVRFGLNLNMPLEEMIKPENIIKIKEKYKKLAEKRCNIKIDKLIDDMFNADEVLDDFYPQMKEFWHRKPQCT